MDINQVSQTWESLINNVELEKVTEELSITETKVTQVKNKMKKLPLAQKMAKET